MSNALGWVKLYRSLLDWEWYDDINTKVLFIHLLLKANHKERAYKGMLIKRGELVTGRIVLSAELGLTEQQIRTSLTKLKSTNEITIKTTNKNSVVSIVNYDLYQDIENDQPTEQPTGNQRITNKQPTDNQQVTTNKNVKNNKNVKKGRKEESLFSFGADAQKNESDLTSDPKKPDKEEKEKSSAEKEKFGKPEFRQALIDAGVEEQHADDWIKVRTAKRAAFTLTVIESLFKECEVNNFKIKDAVRISAEQSWQGFKHAWIQNINTQNNGKQTGITASQGRQQRVDEVEQFRVDNQKSLASRLQKHITGNPEQSAVNSEN